MRIASLLVVIRSDLSRADTKPECDALIECRITGFRLTVKRTCMNRLIPRGVTTNIGT
jgi:hypothetical protein